MSLLKQFEEDEEEKPIVRAELVIDQETITNDNSELNLEENQKYINVLKKYFGYSSFRTPQLKIIKNLIEEKRDQLVVMATGRGKSLCYQFPALFIETGLTVVISPLISLMEDQVMSLALLNVQACLLGTAQKSNDSTEQDLMDGKYKVLFMTPEHLDSAPDLLKCLNDKLGINLLAIDECHCVR
jgi:werner syndrome ATP-dependent helicase